MIQLATSSWQLERGARVRDVGVQFSVWAPKAERVWVRLERGARPEDHPLEPDGYGEFSGLVRGAGPGTDYRYLLDGERALPDPVSRYQPEGVHGPSRVIDPSAFAWTDDEWRGLPMADHAIYEMHVGAFSRTGTFDGAIEHLDELVELGITAVEVMPVAEFPGTRNWGYDGVHLYAVESAYGGPDGFKRFVDAAHARGLAVVLDVVYNHMGPEGNYLGEYGPYFTDHYRTPWGQAVNYDGADSDEVRRFVVDNALYWVTEYHVDGLRLDAIHEIYDFGARHILREIAEAVHEQGRLADRKVQVIGESDLNDPRVIRPAGDAGYGLNAQWSDDFHHAVHAALTGERSGYYADFGAARQVAKALEDRFVYAGSHSPHRRRRHGAPAVDLPAERFVICLQNHDQVGNRAAGERLSALLGFEQQKLAAALLLLAPYVPLLFLGEEYGETRPFQYFASHEDEALVEAVRAGRRMEFASFGWSSEVPDPFAVETFERSKLDRALRAQPRHAELHALYRDLLHLRREEPALRPGGARLRVEFEELDDTGGEAADGRPNGSEGSAGLVFTELQPPAGATLLGFFNLSRHEAVEVEVNAGAGKRARVVLSTDAARYGGDDAVVEGWRVGGAVRDGDRAFGGTLPPSTAVLCRVGEL